MSNCQFPICPIHSNPKYCIRRNGDPVLVKPVYKIPQRSKKMIKLQPKYIKRVIAFLSKNPLCKINMDGCAKVSQCVHHVAGRIGEKLMDETGWMPSCFSCNLAVEINDKEAREKGFKKSKF